MRRLLFLFLVALAWFACSKTEVVPGNLQSSSSENARRSTTVHRRIILKQGSDKGLYISNKNFSYSPGDTLVLTGAWSYCSLENIVGTPTDYVILINQGGQIQMTNGFSFTNCRYIKLLGSGSSDKYGFRVSQTVNSGVGVTVQGRSSYIEISKVDVYNKTYGYWVKQDASCIDSLQYPNWYIDHITIHDGRIRVAHQEAMYLGSTDPNGLRGITCNGKIIFPKPLRLSNIDVYNMIIDSTYRSGIQLSGASSGKNTIHNNTITNIGYEYNWDGQGSGISLGGYTRADITNNTITNTYTMGISSLGAGLLNITNNTVKNSGSLSGHTVSGMASIMVDTRNTSPADSTTFNISSNTLGTNTDANIRVYRTFPTYTTKNVICSNGNVTMRVDTNIKWTACN